MPEARENRFCHAIVRPPGDSFAAGITTAGLGPPDIGLARRQHIDYCRALEGCGLELTVLDADRQHPDSCFVEDTAVVTAGFAVVTNPGAPSRKGEAAAMNSILASRFPRIYAVTPPGTLDGGDVCQAGQLFFIGISQRSNEEGTRQLAAILAGEGYECRFVSILGDGETLHLKSGMAYLGDDRLVLIRKWMGRREFKGYETVAVEAGESYGANCLRINDRVLMPAGHPGLESALMKMGYDILVLDMSEFRKMDGGLSCLSLRY